MGIAGEPGAGQLPVLTEEITVTGWIAHYRSPDEIDQKKPGKTLPVDGWSPDGDALVVDKRAGCRIEASSLPYFRGLRADDTTPVSVIPGGGWQIASDDPQSSPTPLVGWAIDAHGWGCPLIVDSDGVVSPVDDSLNGCWLVPPDCEPSRSPYRPRVDS